MKPDISVLIVNYNVKDYLLQCLRSLQAVLPGVTKEVIVVDNNSQDNSVADLQPLFPDVTWIALPENIGFGKANNRGLEDCNGRYVLFLNPDTIVGHDTLNVMVRYMDNEPSAGIAGCKVLNPDGSFQVACRRGLPTPWASFCKLFGLQSLFPASPLFARYNLTYKPIDATYEVDALIGAFMVVRTDLVKQQGGFDPAFFMYGEDIDLCYRIQKSGSKVMYVHTTSIVHYKGESTKRSSINEVRVFYDAMEIFARKHFGGSRVFLALLRLGIVLRALMARAMRKRVEVVTWVLDMISINVALLAATAVRFDGPFGFPSYAYPIVQIVVSLSATLSLMAVGEYVEYRPTVRRSIVGLLVTFFFLSSLTYFFKEYAFSRGVVLMTIGFSAVLFSLTRGLIAFMDSSRGPRTRRILLVGLNEHTMRIAEELQRAEHRHAEIVGVVATSPFTVDHYAGIPVVGDIGYLTRILEVTNAQEVVLTDPDVSRETAMELMIASSAFRARFHMAAEYDDIVTARIINDVAGVEPTVAIPPLMRFRNRVAKRTLDIVVSALVLTLGLPVLILRRTDNDFGNWLEVLSGKRSVVGLFSDGKHRTSGKEGITGLVKVSDPRKLSKQTIEHLNDYYVYSYSIALDVEIFLKHLLRRNRG
ncbi:MAG: glycosyltransferase [Ignavibacteria bacterium]|nr:glycosyltransferase [Ignavibacteria bacterium]